jgi:seryl-tRNA synthetase
VEDGGGTGARDYADLGEHVASILTAAEEAAEQIRADATREAEELRASSREESRSHIEAERRRATDEAQRLVSSAAADARAIRDTARAAARRITEEGQRRLHELRTDARALEGRFETAVEQLNDLMAQLDDLVQDSIGRPDEQRDAERPEPAAERRDEAEDTEDTPVADLWPRAVPDLADEAEWGVPDEQPDRPEPSRPA